MQENTSQQTPPIYTQNLKASGKTYFFDVKAAKNGNKYLSVSESWIKDGQKHRGNITIFPEQLQDFTDAILAAAEHAKA